MKLLFAYIKLLRPHQWIKNAFVFTGLIFAHAWDKPGIVSQVVLATIAFCLCSSCVYVYNDLIDRKSDQLHPRKKHRPIASGKISSTQAAGLALVLFVAGLALGLCVSLWVGFILLSYLILNIFYTHWFKHIVILDVFVIAAGFMLRILAGTLGVGIPPSQWLLFCGLMLTLFLGFSKRRSEMKLLNPEQESNHQRAVLKNYQSIFLDKMIGIAAACSIISYSLYTMSPVTIQEQGTSNLIYTVPLVAYGIFRYIYLLHEPLSERRAGEDTARDLLKDRQLQVSVGLWLALVLLIIS